MLIPGIFDVALLAVALFLCQEYVRRLGLLGGMAIGAAPLVFTPYWLLINDHLPLFWWVKLCSMLVTTCGLTLARCTRLGERRWFLFAGFCLLEVNIFEAVVQDACRGQPYNFMNAVTGVLLILTLIYRLDSVHIRSVGTCRDARWDSMSRGWILGYTLWNATFVYLNFPALAGQHVAVLASAWIVSIAWPQRWAQARVYTLTIYLVLLFTFPSYFWTGAISTVSWEHASAARFVVLGSLLYMIAYASWFAYARLREHIVRRHMSTLVLASPSGNASSIR